MNLKEIVLFLGLSVLASMGITAMNIQEIFINVNVSPVVNLILVYDSGADRGGVVADVMREIGNKREGYFRVNYIDCNEVDEGAMARLQYCTPENRNRRPALMFSKPKLNVKDENGINVG